MGKPKAQFRKEVEQLPDFDAVQQQKLVCGRRVVFIAKVGSVNCNLNDESSDSDYKVYVLPSHDDLYTGNRFVAQQTGAVDYSVHDIRELEKHWVTSPVNHIEVLYSVEAEALSPEIKELLALRESIACMNLPALYDSAMGRYHNGVGGMKKGTEATASLVAKHGYCTKSFLLAYRSLDFLVRYQANGFSSYEEAFRYTDKERADRLQMKRGYYTKDEAENLLSELLERVQAIKSLYRSHPLNEETKTKVRTLLLKLVTEHMKEGE